MPPEALAALAQHVQAPEQPIALLDPCAGRGEALYQWAVHCGATPAGVYAIELEEGRSQACQERLAGSHVLAPCSFFGTGISAGSFSFVWCNPPYDDEIGGGRVEQGFLVRASQLLRAKGILALACPEHVSEKYELREQLMTWFDDLSVVPYPDAHRAFGEVVIFGRKLAKPRQGQLCRWSECCGEAGVYLLPPAAGPKRFEKTELTGAEKAEALARSPLRRLLEPPTELPLPEPGLPLTHGQLALVLASGHLNGVVAKPGEEPHVIRGVATKEAYLADVQQEETSSGTTKTVSTYSQRIVLTVRALCPDGTIKDFA